MTLITQISILEKSCLLANQSIVGVMMMMILIGYSCESFRRESKERDDDEIEFFLIKKPTKNTESFLVGWMFQFKVRRENVRN